MRLARFLGYRLLLAIPVVLGIVVLNFFLIHLAPGDATGNLGIYYLMTLLLWASISFVQTPFSL